VTTEVRLPTDDDGADTALVVADAGTDAYAVVAVTPTIAATVPADTAIIRMDGIFIVLAPEIYRELDATGLTE
jgi:hypothetical protein